MEDIRYHISLIAWQTRPALECAVGLVAALAILLLSRAVRLFLRRWDWMADETGHGE